MSVTVNWSAGFVAAAALAVLLGLTWWLRGGRAVLLACTAVGVSAALLGAAAGNIVTIAGGAVIIAVALPSWLWLWTGRCR